MAIELIPPDIDEIEISLFGPGFGESVLVHSGDNDWIVIDSCLCSDRKTPAALKYLETLKIDPATSIKLIVATHWHDDHIRGLAKIVEQCKNCNFVCSAALKTEEFATLNELYGKRSLMGLTSGIEEFSNILDLLISKKKVPILASNDKCLWRTINSNGMECVIYSLSPSDKSIINAITEISSLIPKEGTLLRRVPPISPNNTSVVLWVDFGKRKALLGSDLEMTNNPLTGWEAIIQSVTKPQGKASVYKIPHHGSLTADHSEIWSDMLISNPYSMLSPFIRGKVTLPKKTDKERICKRSPNAYITSETVTKSSLNRSSIVEKQIKETVRSLRTIKYSSGQIRFRAKITDNEFKWQTHLFGEAKSLCHST